MHLDQSNHSLDRSNLVCFEFPEPATFLFLYFDLQHLEHCLIIPIDLGIYIYTSLFSWFTNYLKLLEPNKRL